MQQNAKDLLERMQAKITLNTAASTTPSFDGDQYVTFSIDGQLFATSMAEVGDIVKTKQPTSVPLSHPVVKGLINVRGRIVTILDLRHLFNQPQTQKEPSTTAITYEYENETYAISVDSVSDIISFAESELQTNLPNLSPIIKTCSKGILKYKKNLVLVLSVSNTMRAIMRCTQSNTADSWADMIEGSA